MQRTESTVRPQPVTIEQDGASARVVLAVDIQEEVRDGTTLYSYEELVSRTVWRDGLLDAITARFDAWVVGLRSATPAAPTTLSERVARLEAEQAEMVEALLASWGV